MYASAVGLEVHVQLLTRTKVFCGCRAAFGDEPNTNVCPVCLGLPGTLPALNAEAIRMGYLVARALGCTLESRCTFERKNYFYPDMPKNYQISQFRSPLGLDGMVEIELRQRRRRVRIREVHLEEDAGKMVHAGDASLLDYNRAGTPLLEIVTQPDLEVGEEAEVFLQQLRRLVRWLGVCDGNMEEGSLRCDANVSVNPEGRGLGSKVEVKNLNSSKFVRRAITHEIARQEEILERGGSVTQETRLWNENRDQTEGMRTKESAHDYRYFPEPDLPPFAADAAFLAGIEAALPELPDARAARLARDLGLGDEAARQICEERDVADYFERAVALGADAATAATWLAGDVRKHLNRTGLALTNSPLTPERFAALLRLLAERRIHGRIAKSALEAVFAEDRDPAAIIRDKGWEQIVDPAVLGAVADAVLERHADTVAAIRRGDHRRITYLVGEIMRETSGRAEPTLLQQVVKERLDLAVIRVLSFGGAITARRTPAGEVVAGDASEIMELLRTEAGVSRKLAFEEVEVARVLSEEITPDDWAHLVAAIDEHLRSGRAAGLVVAHGTDTLAYTASLVSWLFARPPVPVVFAAALEPPGSPKSDAIPTLKTAIETAASARPGVHVAFGGRVLPPLNLKFERVAPDGFRTWNPASPVSESSPLFDDPPPLADRDDLRRRLEGAINACMVVRVHPGLRGDHLIALMDRGVRCFVLELYDTGTASLRESPYSLRPAFLAARGRGVRFFCTSQQEGIVDFSGYVTAHELWREGAVPMGSLTTESAFTKLVAALAFSDSDEEAAERVQRGAGAARRTT